MNLYDEIISQKIPFNHEFNEGLKAAAEIVRKYNNPISENYIKIVPDKCDRIVWRNRYYHLPIKD
jgi:hypothetical protein